VWGFLAALLYHLLAGLRHLIMDLGFAETLSSAKITALTVFILFGLGVMSLGVWLWV
jgi:succinate dehydrogenase / fumarate reductase cytochrome b subunit